MEGLSQIISNAIRLVTAMRSSSSSSGAAADGGSGGGGEAPPGAVAVAAAAANAVPVPSAGGWFRALFGFDERSIQDPATGRVDPVALRDRFTFDPATGTLRSKVNDQQYDAGLFATPALQDLRQRARQLGILPAALGGGGGAQKKAVGSGAIAGRRKLVVKHIATRDVFELHTEAAYRGSTFMAASQFNCLEFPGPRVVPEDGVTQYVYDRTQGPACALAAPASTVVRNYFVPTNGRVGQTRDNQLDNLAELLAALTPLAPSTAAADTHGHADVVSTAAVDGRDLVEVMNGYTSSDDTHLSELNRRIAATCAPPGTSGGGGGGVDGSRPNPRRDALMGRLRVGVHSHVEVPWAPRGRFHLLPAAARTQQRVTQVYCSAVACGYSRGQRAQWEPIARLVLDASYEATLWTAALEALDAQQQQKVAGSGRVLLTFLGGGVFSNDPAWIEGAIARACVLLEDVGLEVVVCHFGHVDPGVVQSLDKARAHWRRQLAGKSEADDDVAGAPP